MRFICLIFTFLTLIIAPLPITAMAQDIEDWDNLGKGSQIKEKRSLGSYLESDEDGFFSNSRDLNTYFANNMEAYPMSDSEINTSLAEDGMMLQSPETNNRVGIDLRK